jgi:D-psicose/D-tagatose/L-ribulose 3-epimerase
MMLGISLFLWSDELTESHLPLLERLRESGYDGVEVPITHFDAAIWRSWRKRFEELGLVCLMNISHGAADNPISEDAHARSRAAETLRRAIDVCHEAGAPILTGPLHSALGVFSGSPPTLTEWSHSIEHAQNAAAHASEAGVTLGMEFLNRFECYLLNTAADTARYVTEVGAPNVRVHFDTFHAHIEERDAAAAIRACGPILGYIHMSENDRGTPGTGSVPWGPTFSALRDVGYDGWLTVEAFGRHLPSIAAATHIWRPVFESAEQVASDSLRFMSGWIGREATTPGSSAISGGTP